jgi:hypothetical protein
MTYPKKTYSSNFRVIYQLKWSILFCLLRWELPNNHGAPCCTFDTIEKPSMSKRCFEVVSKGLGIWCKSFWIFNNIIIENPIKSKLTYETKLGSGSVGKPSMGKV